MKKAIITTLALALTLTLAACSLLDNLAPSGGTGAPQAQSPTQSAQDGGEAPAPDPAPSGAGSAQITLVNDTGSPFYLQAVGLVVGKYYAQNGQYDVIENGGYMVLELNDETEEEDSQYILYLVNGEQKFISWNQSYYGSIPAGSVITINMDYSCTVKLPDGSVISNKIDLSVAKGFDGREIFLRLTVPLLHEYMSGEKQSDIYIRLNDSIILFYSGGPPSSVNTALIFEYDHESVMCTYEGSDVLFCINPYEGLDWDSLQEEIAVFTSQTGDIIFHKSDIEVPLSELLPPGTEDMRKLSAQILLDNAVISAKDNGDGTITFTYRDATLVPPCIYMASWEPPSADGWMVPPSGSVRFEMTVAAWVARDVEAVHSGFKYPPPSSVYPTDPWNARFFNLMDVFTDDTLSSPYPAFGIPEELTLDFAAVDENGLTVIWTQNIVPKFSIDDILNYSDISVKFLFDDSGYIGSTFAPGEIFE